MTFKKYLFFLGFGRWFVFSILCAFLYLKRSFLFVCFKKNNWKHEYVNHRQKFTFNGLGLGSISPQVRLRLKSCRKQSPL